MKPSADQTVESRETVPKGMVQQFCRAKEIVGAIGVVVAITVVMLALVEIASFCVLRNEHVTPLYRHLVSSTLYQGEPWAQDLRREMRHSLNLGYRPYVVWQAVPFRGTTVVIDQDGLRRTMHSECDGSEAYTVWIFGGSTLWGWGSPDWATIPSLLAEHYQHIGRVVCVRNYGQPAWVSTQEVVELCLELKRATRRPDLVVFYDGINDVYSFYQSGGKIDVHHNVDSIADGFALIQAAKRGSFGYLFETNTAQLLAKLGLWLTEKRGRSELAKAPDSELARQLEVAYVDNIGLVDLLAREYGFAYTFFWQPCLLAGEKPLTEEEQALRHDANQDLGGQGKEFQRMYDMVRAQRRPHLFYIADAFDQYSETLYLDWMHVGPEGNRLIAARMFEILHQQGL